MDLVNLLGEMRDKRCSTSAGELKPAGLTHQARAAERAAGDRGSVLQQAQLWTVRDDVLPEGLQSARDLLGESNTLQTSTVFFLF